MNNYAALLLRTLLLYEASLGNVICLSVQCLPYNWKSYHFTYHTYDAQHARLKTQNSLQLIKLETYAVDESFQTVTCISTD